MNEKAVYTVLAAAFAVGWGHAALERAELKRQQERPVHHAADCRPQSATTNRIESGIKSP